MEVLLQSDAAEAYSHAQSPQYQGRVLHHLDSQLANSQLERYLPTPSTRYQMMRDRILKELTELENDLVQYRQLQGWEYDTKIEALEERLSLLRHKLQLVDDKLSEINPFQSMYTTLARLKPGAASAEAKRKPKRGPWAFIPNPNRDICNEVAEINLELETLQHIMEEQLHDPCFTADQIGRLVNQYDLNLRKAEKMIAKLKSRRSLTEKLNTKLNDFYRSLYRDQR
jgi:predicted  nucleic acid-binding Zn-ribbon protein